MKQKKDWESIAQMVKVLPSKLKVPGSKPHYSQKKESDRDRGLSFFQIEEN
jgi:hypothetical protein